MHYNTLFLIKGFGFTLAFVGLNSWKGRKGANFYDHVIPYSATRRCLATITSTVSHRHFVEYVAMEGEFPNQ